jgi:hypothetical protein
MLSFLSLPESRTISGWDSGMESRNPQNPSPPSYKQSSALYPLDNPSVCSHLNHFYRIGFLHLSPLFLSLEAHRYKLIEHIVIKPTDKFNTHIVLWPLIFQFFIIYILNLHHHTHRAMVAGFCMFRSDSRVAVSYIIFAFSCQALAVNVCVIYSYIFMWQDVIQP